MIRIKLDFHIDSAEERQDYVNHYLGVTKKNIEHYLEKYKDRDFPFPHKPNNEELETMANYVLYGKTNSSVNFDTRDKKGRDGRQSVVKAGYVEIKTRKNTWSKKEPESLDNLFETSAETGNPFEVQHGLIGGMSGKKGSQTTYKTPKANFSRESCISELKGNNDFLLKQYESLWKDIDKLEYLITHFEIRTGKRILAIRQELIDRLTQEEREALDKRSKGLNMYDWSKQRKLLVELRQQQYTMRDSYKPSIYALTNCSYREELDIPEFISILPLGVKNNDMFIKEVGDEHFEKDFQRKALSFIINCDRALNKYEKGDKVGVFDFRNINHIVLLIYAKYALSAMEVDNISNREELAQLLDTLDYYIEVSNLSDLHKMVIDMKSKGFQNKIVAEKVNKKYDKTYSANYISTIFHSKCCEGIAQAAHNHYKVLDTLLLGREEFKMCNTCGRLLVKDAENFVRKARSKDGLSGRCKSCDKDARQKVKK